MGYIEKYFSTEDQEKIRAAVTEAESRSGGEIVTYFVERSDTYDEATLRGVLFGFVAALVSRLLVDYYAPWGLMLPPTYEVLWLFSGAVLGFLLLLIPTVRRLVAGREVLDRRVEQRAIEAFVEAEVFATANRSGILIFLSLFEHEVVVLGDSGINSRVPHEEWESVVTEMVEAMRSGNRTEGFGTAIRHCGDLLEKYEVTFGKEQDDTNELSDGLRMGR